VTFDEGVALCKARGLGVSDCLDLLDPLCGDRLPVATAGASGVIFSCGSVPSARKAAALLAESQATIAKANPGPPWLLIGGGVAVIAIVVYVATR